MCCLPKNDFQDQWIKTKGKFKSYTKTESAKKEDFKKLIPGVTEDMLDLLLDQSKIVTEVQQAVYGTK
jgi:hypothetical protein